MSDWAALALAVGVCAGARLGWPVPWPLPVALVLAALVLRRPWLVVASGFALALALSAVATAGLRAPPDGVAQGVAVLLGDPADVHGALRVDARLGRRHVEAWAHGAAAASLRGRLAGEQVWVRGRLRAPPERVRARLAAQHVAARFEVLDVGASRPGNLASRAANGLRRTLERGARPLHGDDRSLLLGVVLGDVRDERPALADAFRAAGLSHLLVVSGENLAFVLALAGPVLRRLGLRARWVATLGVIAFFGLLTRWEPSVLRAGAMAALACTASTLGRPASRLRLLALAVSAVVLVDPLLVGSLSFRLSVGATVGIALLARPVARRIPGPAWLADPLAVTFAAQVGVAPVALPAFGGLPLASLPANLLAVPAAAPLTAWGFVGGGLAGVLGPPFDRWLHVPTRVLAAWLAMVARWAAGLPLPVVRPGPAALLGGLVAVGWGVRWTLRSGRWSWPWDRTGSTSPPGRS